MGDKKTALALILFSLALVDIGQLLLKKGLLLTQPDFSGHIVTTFSTVFSNPYIIFGILLFVASSVTWLIAISKTRLSFAYPLMSLSYVVVSVGSWYFFDEALSPLRLLGLGVIIGGVVLLSRT